MKTSNPLPRQDETSPRIDIMKSYIGLGLFLILTMMPREVWARILTVYTTHNTTLDADGAFAIDGSASDFPLTCPAFMPIVSGLSEASPPGIVMTGNAPAPCEGLSDTIEFFNRQTGRWSRSISPSEHDRRGKC